MNKLLNTTLTLIFFIFILVSCHKDEKVDQLVPTYIQNCDSFDIFLVVGQSNTNTGFGIDPVLDAPDSNIYQLGRHEERNMKIIRAREPLDSHDKHSDRIGFALTVAKYYNKSNFLISGRKVLIIHCGKGGTGFAAHNWNPGDKLFNDSIYRVNSVLSSGNDNRLIAILWHQGENDVSLIEYPKLLDNMINKMRGSIVKNNKDVPFILGGMVPAWVNLDPLRIKQQEYIVQTVTRVTNTGYVDPTYPFEIFPSNYQGEGYIHYDAENQREIGKRYYEKLVSMLKK
jgi:hypothetical protein